MSRIAYRHLDGILLLDKPAGMSSNGALQVARRLLRAKKGGHTGSLDPLATGLLPLCFGEATKIAGLLLGSAKAYDADVLLGTTTSTDDADGVVLLERPVPTLDAEVVDAVLCRLIGTIRQRAPIYSALKQGGEPLYAKARRGEVVNAPVREVEVHAIELLALAMPRLRLRVTCGSGTYIRSLVRDLGEFLGCGAHIIALRRRWIAPFQMHKMLALDELEQALKEGRHPDSLLLPLAEGLVGFPTLELDAERLACFRLGQRLRDHSFQAGRVAVLGQDGTPAGLAEVDSEGLLVPQRLFNL
ncbi:MAG TPA: tRNA pseudouridine(55) synthase TruB [Xylella taiwanensis]